MSNTVASVFNQTASTYDADRRRLIPGFDRFYATAVGLIPSDAEHILDLGAGTGLLSAFVRERFPDANLHMIDNSAAMLDKACARFKGDAQTSFQLGDYTTCEWGRSYDAIVSALSIHHLTDAAKKALFCRVLTALRPGAVFINAEQILQPTPELEAYAKRQWLTDIRGLGATDAQIEASLFRQTEDRCATIADQLTWLQQSGFQDVRCHFEQGRFAVYAGNRSII